MENRMEDKKTEGLLPLLISIAAAVMYFVSDPTLEWAYPMYSTYRIQTLVWLARRAILILVYGACLVWFLHLKKQGKRMQFGVIGPLLLLYAGYLIASIVNSGTEQLVHWADVVMTSIVPMLLFCLMCSSENSTKRWIHVLSAGYLVLLVLNVVFYYFPQLYVGEAKQWREVFFLGSKNRAGWPVMLGLFFGTLHDRLGGKKWELVLFLILATANALLIHSAMTLIGIFFFLVFAVLPVTRNLAEKTDLAVLVLLIMILFVVLMWFLLPITTSRPVAAVLEMLGKDPWLSDRYAVWLFAMEIILERPFLGYGLQADSSFIPHFNDYGINLHHGHNEMVQTLYEGGLLTLVLALLMLFYTAKRLRGSGRSAVAAVCKVALFTFLLMLQADFIPYYCWYMVALLANCAVLLASPMQEESFSDLLTGFMGHKTKVHSAVEAE